MEDLVLALLGVALLLVFLGSGVALGTFFGARSFPRILIWIAAALSAVLAAAALAGDDAQSAILLFLALLGLLATALVRLGLPLGRRLRRRLDVRPARHSYISDDQN